MDWLKHIFTEIAEALARGDGSRKQIVALLAVIALVIALTVCIVWLANGSE